MYAEGLAHGNVAAKALIVQDTWLHLTFIAVLPNAAHRGTHRARIAIFRANACIFTH
jgi:hypothetical protein